MRKPDWRLVLPYVLVIGSFALALHVQSDTTERISREAQARTTAICLAQKQANAANRGFIEGRTAPFPIPADAEPVIVAVLNEVNARQASVADDAMKRFPDIKCRKGT